MLIKNFSGQFAGYSELDPGNVGDAIRAELMKTLGSMPPPSNAHKTLAFEERFKRVMDCIAIMSSPSSTEHDKEVARKKKYKLMHPDRTHAEQNSRRQKQYHTDENYRQREIAREREQRLKNFKYLEQKHQTSKMWELKIRETALQYLGGKCVICGCDEHPILEFHHTNPEEKLYDIKEIYSLKEKDRFYDEVDKCVLLCESCHQQITIMFRYFNAIKARNLPMYVFIDILEDIIIRKMSFVDISYKYGIPKYTVSTIFHEGFFGPIIAQVKAVLYERERLANAGLPPPADQVLYNPNDYLINLETPENLEAIRRLKEFNREQGRIKGQYFPVPPVKYARGITPENMDEMVRLESEDGKVFFGIPGAFVTPFDIEEADKAYAIKHGDSAYLTPKF